MKVHEFETLVQKLGLITRDSRDRLARFEPQGKIITRTKRSHGRGDLPGYLIRRQLKLNEEQLSGIIDCTLYRSDYLQILDRKGLLPA